MFGYNFIKQHQTIEEDYMALHCFHFDKRRFLLERKEEYKIVRQEALRQSKSEK